MKISGRTSRAALYSFFVNTFQLVPVFVVQRRSKIKGGKFQRHYIL